MDLTVGVLFLTVSLPQAAALAHPTIVRQIQTVLLEVLAEVVVLGLVLEVLAVWLLPLGKAMLAVMGLQHRHILVVAVAVRVLLAQMPHLALVVMVEMGWQVVLQEHQSITLAEVVVVVMSF
jgi:hypothetical protein